MPGAWEFPQNEVLVATLTRETVTMAWARSHREMQLPGRLHEGHEIITPHGAPFDDARNTSVMAMLENNFSYIWFIDDDVIVPPDAYWILKGNDLDVVSGLYYRRADPLTAVAQVKLPDGNLVWLPKWELGKIIPVYHVGAGCLLVKRRVFEMMPFPWFEWLTDHIRLPPLERTSEDFTFCRRLEKHGIVPHVDTRVQCIHAGLSKVTVDAKMSPLS